MDQRELAERQGAVALTILQFLGRFNVRVVERTAERAKGGRRG